MGFVLPEQFSTLRAERGDAEGLLVVKSHKFLPDANELCASGKGVVFYVYRDLRDVVVSIANKEGGSVDHILESQEVEHCLIEFRQWTAVPNALIMKYEYMVNDLPAAIARIAGHMNIVLSQRECRSLAAEHAPDRQFERIDSLRETLGTQGLASGYDPASLLHQNHIHSGASGQWRTHLSARQTAEVERRFGGWLRQHGYQIGSASGGDESSWKARRERLTGRLQRLLDRARGRPR